MVIEELLFPSARQKVLSYIDSNKWYLFDPDDELDVLLAQIDLTEKS